VCSSPPITYSNLDIKSFSVDAAHKFDPKIPVGNTSYDSKEVVYMVNYENDKSKHLLGIKYHTIEEATQDILKQFKEKGWY
jgi:hypothetical protein